MTAEVQAITGQSMQMVEHYAKQVSQKKAAACGNALRTEFCATQALILRNAAPLLC
jgi:hypothetical protein